MSSEAPMLTRREAADYLQISIRTLERWALEGKLIPVRLSPATVRYRRSDVEHLIKQASA